MARRPAARPTTEETRRTTQRTTQRDNPEASSANVRNPTTGARNSPLDWNDAVRFHRLVRTTLGTEGYDAFNALVLDHRQNGLPFPEMVRRITVLFKDHRDLIVGINWFLPPTARIPLPVQNLRRVRIFAYSGDGEH